jgi:hypothetical protein
LTGVKLAVIDPTTNLRKFAAERVDQAVDPEMVWQHVEVGRRAFRAVALAALNPDRRSENNNSFNAACLLTLASTIKTYFQLQQFLTSIPYLAKPELPYSKMFTCE